MRKVHEMTLPVKKIYSSGSLYCPTIPLSIAFSNARESHTEMRLCISSIAAGRIAILLLAVTRYDGNNILAFLWEQPPPQGTSCHPCH